MIDFSTLQGLTIPEGVVTQIADASGRVLWRSTIKFTINGDTYIADRGMTWAEWFASDYNTTGETEGTITDSNGNEVSMDAVIVGGTAYEVGFGPPMATITITGSGNGVADIVINGEWYNESATIEVPVGTIVQCYTSVESASDSGLAYLSINGVKTYHNTCDGMYPEYVVVGNATINCNYAYGKDKYGYIEITEE